MRKQTWFWLKRREGRGEYKGEFGKMSLKSYLIIQACPLLKTSTE
jgi:hypothetical protein